MEYTILNTGKVMEISTIILGIIIGLVLFGIGYLTASMMFIKKQDDENYEKEYKERIDKK